MIQKLGILSPVNSQSLITIGSETGKVLVLWKSDNNENPNKSNNIGSHWDPFPGPKKLKAVVVLVSEKCNFHAACYGLMYKM